jgi:ankyrin repeat protein
VAAVLGRAELCRLLLEKGANPHADDSYSNPVLHLAVASGNADTVKERLLALVRNLFTFSSKVIKMFILA